MLKQWIRQGTDQKESEFVMHQEPSLLPPDGAGRDCTKAAPLDHSYSVSYHASTLVSKQNIRELI